MKNKTGKKDGSGALALAPVGLSLLAAHAQSLWLAAAAGVLIFIFVAAVPYCRKRESLWVFLLIGAASIPINLFILGKYDLWIYLTASGEERGIVYYMSLLQYTLLLSSIEEIIGGLIARLIWKRQYKLVIPVEDDI